MKLRGFLAFGLMSLGSYNPSLAAAPANDPVVATDKGRVSGFREGGVKAFLGIPYAASPAGENRWRAPQPVVAWNGMRSAKTFGPSCPQAIVSGGFGPWVQEYVPSGAVDEDCLSVNVWSPPAAGREKLPVLVWIHGGGFTSGSASVPIYDGAPLAREGVVVVSINYRLGTLGTLAASEFRDTGGGNFWLQDQIAALRWVQRNIGAFGGDSRRVTISGQSAGALSVHALMLSSHAKGLFRQAIPQSGVGLGLGVGLMLGTRESAEKSAAALLQEAGVKSVAEARKLSFAQLGAAAAKTGARPGYGPYADGVVLPLDPGAALAAGRYNDVPMMIGLTADEGSGLNMNYRVSDPGKYEAALRARTGVLASEFEKFYPATTPTKSFPALLRDGGVASVIEWNRLHARTSHQPLYSYVWTHVEPGPQSAIYGAFHTSDVPYIFKTLDKAPQRSFTAEDRRVSEIVSRYWINFVKTGNPNGPGLPAWPQFGARDEAIELGGSFGPYPELDPKAIELFRKHVASGGWLLVM